MKPSIDTLEQAAVAQQCRALRLPAVADQCASLAEQAIKQRLTYLRYLEALLLPNWKSANATPLPGGSRMHICRA